MSSIQSFLEDFNPRTREGCDLEAFYQKTIDYVISIHAPVKGATQLVLDFRRDVNYFNPRTREGCDFLRRHFLLRTCHFNPRTREGCDLPVVDDNVFRPIISIHAPVKGATQHYLRCH